MLGVYLAYMLATFSKASSYETGVRQVNTVIGIIYATPVVQVLLFLVYRKRRRDIARGILYGACFWILVALLHYWFFKGFVS